MANLTPANKLLQKEVSRKEFLSIVGVGAVTVAGASSLLHFLTGNKKLSRSTRANSYGSNPYGV